MSIRTAQVWTQPTRRQQVAPQQGLLTEDLGAAPRAPAHAATELYNGGETSVDSFHDSKTSPANAPLEGAGCAAKQCANLARGACIQYNR